MPDSTTELAIRIVAALHPLIEACDWHEPHGREAVTVKAVERVLRDGGGEPTSDNNPVQYDSVGLEVFTADGTRLTRRICTADTVTDAHRIRDTLNAGAPGRAAPEPSEPWWVVDLDDAQNLLRQPCSEDDIRLARAAIERVLDAWQVREGRP